MALIANCLTYISGFWNRLLDFSPASGVPNVPMNIGWPSAMKSSIRSVRIMGRGRHGIQTSAPTASKGHLRTTCAQLSTGSWGCHDESEAVRAANRPWRQGWSGYSREQKGAAHCAGVSGHEDEEVAGGRGGQEKGRCKGSEAGGCKMCQKSTNPQVWQEFGGGTMKQWWGTQLRSWGSRQGLDQEGPCMPG